MTYGTFIEAFGQFGRQLSFLSKAIGRDETRQALCYIRIEPSESNEGSFSGVATDGRRLHVVDPLICASGIEAGSWRFLRATPKSAWITKVIFGEKEGGAFPNYKRVIPAGSPNYHAEYHSGFHGCALTSAINLSGKFPEATAINASFLSDLGDEYWDVSWYGQSKPVVFESGCYKAVIMPLSLDND
jgi:hypothetical protein